MGPLIGNQLNPDFHTYLLSVASVKFNYKKFLISKQVKLGYVIVRSKA